MHRGMQERRGATKGSSGVRAILSGGGEGPKEIPAGNFSPSFAALCVRTKGLFVLPDPEISKCEKI